MKFIVSLLLLSLSLWAINYEDAVRKAQKEDKKILVELVMESCPFCEQVDKYILTKVEVQTLLEKGFVFLKLDIDKNEIPDFLLSRMTPTFYFLNAKGDKILHEIKGAPSKSQFINQLEYVTKMEN